MLDTDKSPPPNQILLKPSTCLQGFSLKFHEFRSQDHALRCMSGMTQDHALRCMSGMTQRPP